MSSELELDTKGLLCPLPVVKASQAITRVKSGGILKILATDPAAKQDLPAWADRVGHEVVQVNDNGTVIEVFVRKCK
ncbi:MAG: sulfurtransferase TusA family protein [Candidatus Bathyarchaeia archaeon]